LIRLRLNGHPIAIVVLALFLIGCDTETSIPPTPTFPILAASQTVAPAAPTLPPTSDSVNVGERSFTPGAPAVSIDNPAVTVTPTPAPTQQSFPMQFVADDGLSIAGIYYAAPARPAPTVLLLHMAGSNKEAWGLFGPQLQAAGHNVLAIDLRGSGDTGGKLDWSKAPQDISGVLARLAALPGVDAQRISIIGADVGANLAVGACADSPTCKAVVMLSPTSDNQGINPADALARSGSRPLLIVASRGDRASADASIALDKLSKGDHRLIVQEGGEHGTALLDAHPDLAGAIVQWLVAHGA
jgi:alpha-beta hydrolase superfamily lysophospholipase